jgi:RNA polymerase-binding transcription factor DksA
LTQIKTLFPVHSIMHHMNTLTEKQMASLKEAMARRKSQLLDEIREVLARSGNAHHAELVGGVGDMGDEAAASLLRDISEAEVLRDIGEVRDIAAAEQRMADGQYGLCIDCGEPVAFERLKAYPSAKRCVPCQQHREKTRAPSKYTGH